MMKRYRVFFVMLLVAVILTGCGGGGTKASAKAVSIAQQAVSTADRYLDRGISASAATDDLADLNKEMEYVTSDRSASSYTTDFSISSDIVLLSHAITMDGIDKTAKTYDEVISARNKLAKEAGLKTR